MSRVHRVAGGWIEAGSAFFFSGNGPFDTAGMNGDPELRQNKLCQPNCPEGPAFLLLCRDEAHELRIEFVSALGTPLSRHQAGEPGAGKVVFGLIVGWPRYPEEGCGASLRGPVDLHRPKHFVLHLRDIVWIEERVALEPGGLYVFGMGIE